MNFSKITAPSGVFSDGDWIEKKDQDPNGEVRLIQLADIGIGDFKNKSSRYITAETAKRLNCTYLRKGDILIARLPDPLGRACVFPLEGPCITAVDVTIVRINNPGQIDNRYLMHLINSPQFSEQIKQYESGTTRKRISRKNLDRIEFSMPPIKEQQRIVFRIEELFSQLDAIEATLRTVKDQLAVYRQAVLKEAFYSFSEKTTIRSISSIVTSGSRGWAQFYGESGARFIRITDLTRESIILKNDNPQYVSLPNDAEGKRTKLQSNDVLVSITADLGSIALIPDDIGEAYVNQHIAMIRFQNPKQSEFMAWYLKSDYGQKELLKNKRGAGKLGLGLDDIRDTIVPVVSDNVASSVVESIDARLSICKSIERTMHICLQQSQALRQSILKQAFDGEE